MRRRFKLQLHEVPETSTRPECGVWCVTCEVWVAEPGGGLFTSFDLEDCLGLRPDGEYYCACPWKGEGTASRWGVRSLNRCTHCCGPMGPTVAHVCTSF